MLRLLSYCSRFVNHVANGLVFACMRQERLSWASKEKKCLAEIWIRLQPRRVRLQSLCPGCIVNRKKLVHRGVQNFAFMSLSSAVPAAGASTPLTEMS